MSRPPQIRKLSDEFGNYALSIACRACGHVRVSDPATLARRVGWDCGIAELALRLRCGKCGAKRTTVSVDEALRRRKGAWR